MKPYAPCTPIAVRREPKPSKERPLSPPGGGAFVNPLQALLALALLLLTSAVASALPAVDGAPPPRGGYLGPHGQPLPFDSEEQVVEFLKSARVVASKELRGGINRPLKLRLEKDGVEANAVFRTVDHKRKEVTLNGRIYRNFHDSFIYECAAYRLSRLLGIDNVPPCARRSLAGTDGTIQLWVESARTEQQRQDAGEESPYPLTWARQRQTMYLFDTLIYNFDRNQGNMLITPDWKLWFIDHTRSFRPEDETPSLERIIWCDRSVFEKLQALDTPFLKQHLHPFISRFQIKGLLKRRDKVIAHLQERIDAYGEDRVIYDRDDTRQSMDTADLTMAVTEDAMPADSRAVQ